MPATEVHSAPLDAQYYLKFASTQNVNLQDATPYRSYAAEVGRSRSSLSSGKRLPLTLPGASASMMEVDEAPEVAAMDAMVLDLAPPPKKDEVSRLSDATSPFALHAFMVPPLSSVAPKTELQPALFQGLLANRDLLMHDASDDDEEEVAAAAVTQVATAPTTKAVAAAATAASARDNADIHRMVLLATSYSRAAEGSSCSSSSSRASSCHLGEEGEGEDEAERQAQLRDLDLMGAEAAKERREERMRARLQVDLAHRDQLVQQIVQPEVAQLPAIGSVAEQEAVREARLKRSNLIARQRLQEYKAEQERKASEAFWAGVAANRSSYAAESSKEHNAAATIVTFDAALETHKAGRGKPQQEVKYKGRTFRSLHEAKSITEVANDRESLILDPRNHAMLYRHIDGHVSRAGYAIGEVAPDGFGIYHKQPEINEEELATLRQKAKARAKAESRARKLQSNTGIKRLVFGGRMLATKGEAATATKNLSKAEAYVEKLKQAVATRSPLPPSPARLTIAARAIVAEGARALGVVVPGPRRRSKKANAASDDE